MDITKQTSESMHKVSRKTDMSKVAEMDATNLSTFSIGTKNSHFTNAPPITSDPTLHLPHIDSGNPFSKRKTVDLGNIREVDDSNQP